MRERASASPIVAEVAQAPARPARRRRSAPAITGPLSDLQRWFLEVVTHPGSVTDGVADARTLAGVDIDRILTPGPRLGALDRIAVYHGGYTERLVECLADDYPALAYALGEMAFRSLCKDAIASHPSRNPNLNFFGRPLAGFCLRRAGRFPHRRFAHDLARLEWAMVEVLHAEAPPALDRNMLSALPPAAWAGLRLAASPTSRILRFSHPVNRFYQAFRDEGQPVIPAAEASTTAVYRKGFRIWRMDLTPSQANMLERLFAGAPLAVALEEAANQSDAPVPAMITRWFTGWVADGLFAAVELAP